MGPQDAAFARIIHERVLNTLHLIALGQAPSALVAETLTWIDDPGAWRDDAHPGGLADLVEGAVRRSGLTGVMVVVPPGLEFRVEPSWAALADAIVEALRNAGRHAAARRIEVRADRVDGSLRVVIADDGIGFDTSSSARLGLSVGIHGAMDGVGGRAEVRSAAGRGTRVTLWLPQHESDLVAGEEEAGLIAQWPEVAAGARALLGRLAADEIDSADSEVVERARIEEGRIRTWLDCRRVDSGMAREIWRCVSRAADEGRHLQAAITGDGGIAESSDLDLMPILGRARSVTVMLGPGWEELLAVVDSSEVDDWNPDPRAQVQTVADPAGAMLVRMRRG